MRSEGWRIKLKDVVKKRIKEKQGQKKDIRVVSPIVENSIKKTSIIKNIITEESTTTLISKSMNERDKLRVFGTPLSVLDKRFGENKTNIKYQKKVFVDYDVIICIPSFNRYKKIKRLITQFYEQKTKYTFKIILLNDGSIGGWYNKLAKEYPEIIYLKNKISNGKTLHWYCYNQMWENLKEMTCHAVLQMDDDFILSNNFLNTIVDLFFIAKEHNASIMAISPHLWSFKPKVETETWWNFKDFVDGIALIDDMVIRNMNYEMQPVDVEAVSKVGAPVRAWTQISSAIKNMKCIIYRTSESLVYHDGNDDSKLHGDVRNNGKAGVYTQKYIGNL